MLQALAQARPEWTPWLGLLGVMLDQAGNREWEGMVPPLSAGAPLLGACAVQRNGIVADLFGRFMKSAAGSDAPALAALARAPRAPALAHDAFEAALNADDARLDLLAAEAGVEAAAFRAVTGLLPMPFLQACARAWASHLPRGWREGYCPLCGAWPALAEVCGVERARYLRCGRCGSAWEAHCLLCAYCGMSDHDQLGTLVPEATARRVVIEVCNGCRGYLKSFTTLSAGSPESVAIRDLESVELDLVAAGRGYRRPARLGCELRLALAEDTRAA